MNIDFVRATKAGVLLEADGEVVKVSKNAEIIVISGRVFESGKKPAAVFRAIIKKAGPVSGLKLNQPQRPKPKL